MDDNLQTYTVTITETLSKDVEVEATSRDEAEQIVKANWRNSDYILDAENFVDVEFEARPVQREPEMDAPLVFKRRATKKGKPSKKRGGDAR